MAKIDQMMCGRYPLDQVISALQKEIRRGNEENAMFWAMELCDNGFSAYLRRRLCTIVNEDCSDGAVIFVNAALSLWEISNKKKSDVNDMALARIILKMCRCVKTREADDFFCTVNLKKESLRMEIPDYAVDCHTKEGRKNGLHGKYNQGAFEFFKEGTKLDKSKPNEYLLKHAEAANLPDDLKELLIARNMEEIERAKEARKK